MGENLIIQPGDELLLWSNVVATQIAKQINVLSTSKVPPSKYMLH